MGVHGNMLWPACSIKTNQQISLAPKKTRLKINHFQLPIEIISYWTKVQNKWIYLQLGELLFDYFFFFFCLSRSDNVGGIWTAELQMQNSSISTDDASNWGLTHCWSAMLKLPFVSYTDNTLFTRFRCSRWYIVSLNDRRPLHVASVSFICGTHLLPLSLYPGFFFFNQSAVLH